MPPQRKRWLAAEAEAIKNGWGVAIAIVDSGANLVMLQRLDNAQLSSVRIAEQKARTAAEFRRPTKVFEDAVAGGGIGLRVLTFGTSAAEGGVPIVAGGKVIGAIGVSWCNRTRTARSPRLEPTRSDSIYQTSASMTRTP